ncbi:hypothetical protein P5673_013901 [Acropora cervicornis]|uniref:Endonuclease/exonuclease/phosphatase domain-containing protein n=1 Tax=Acropora cervicornis TaxID=6130 RepID=A0AAD9V6E9_ACRCE|nr:hypothetical protein P5673_013901 [Acropora cervicornis]
MADHVAARLLTYIFFVTSILSLGQFHHLGLTTSSYIVARRFSLGHQRVKLPILKWSKHGVTTISIPDVRYAVGEVFALRCGDIHPHPGPRSTLKSSVNGTRTQANKCSITQDSRNRNHYLTVAHLNVRSMASRENFHLIEQIVVNYDIFTISETWLDPSVYDSDLNIPGYILIRQDRGPQKKGGGLIVYAKSKFKVSVLDTWSSVSEYNFQQLWLKVQCRKFRSFLLCTVYRPPDAPISFLEDLTKTVVESLLQGVTVVLLGDLNCDVLGNGPDGRALNDFCLRFNLAQMVKSPTRVTETSKSIIDVVLTTNESIISSCDVKVCAISDHNLVCMSMKLKTPRSRYAYITTRSYKHYETNKFLSDLECAPFHMVEFFNDLDDRVYAFNCLFLEALNDHAPIKRIKIKSKPNPFISPEIKQLMNKRDAWHKSAIKSGDKLHWNAYRFFRQEVKREIRLAEMEHVRSELRNGMVW